MDVMGRAVSGLRAASQTVAIAADNIANLRSGAPVTAATTDQAYTGYRPQEPTYATGPQGGVVTGMRPVAPAFLTESDTQGGLTGMPNVPLISDMVRLKTAEHAYKAGAALIRTEDVMQRTLLSLKG